MWHRPLARPMRGLPKLTVGCGPAGWGLFHQLWTLPDCCHCPLATSNTPNGTNTNNRRYNAVLACGLCRVMKERKKAGWSWQGGEPMEPKLPGRQTRHPRHPALQANSHMAKKEEMSDGIQQKNELDGVRRGLQRSATASPVPSAVCNCSIPDLNPITHEIKSRPIGSANNGARGSVELSGQLCSGRSTTFQAPSSCCGPAQSTASQSLPPNFGIDCRVGGAVAIPCDPAQERLFVPPVDQKNPTDNSGVSSAHLTWSAKKTKTTAGRKNGFINDRQRHIQ